MRSLVEAHNRVKDFDWEPTYAQKPVRYPTRYKIPAKTKDPFRHLLRDYFSMEEEKDNRQYGALEDALARSNAPAKAERRWMEIMKVAIPVVNFGEYAAMKCTGQLIDTIENAELRQGYMAQMLDEVRHVNQETYLIRYFARHAADPEGFAQGFKFRGTNMFNRAGRAALEAFFVGDPIEGALNLQVVAETAYTNPIFVALTEVAAANGDQATPSVFLSIQSDEARHMANGYSTLAAVVSNPDNLTFLQADFDRAFWRQHAFLDPFVGTVYDYFQTKRSSSYVEKWNEWIHEDWVGCYIEKLAPFGLKVPALVPASARADEMARPHDGDVRVRGVAAAVLALRSADRRDMEWFEQQVLRVVRALRRLLAGVSQDVRPDARRPCRCRSSRRCPPSAGCARCPASSHAPTSRRCGSSSTGERRTPSAQRPASSSSTKIRSATSATRPGTSSTTARTSPTTSARTAYSAATARP